ncbi:hypothetical protein AZZ81_002554, partial [Klebsiella aerogenes]
MTLPTRYKVTVTLESMKKFN